MTGKEKKKLNQKQKLQLDRMMRERRAMKARFVGLAKTPTGREMLAHMIHLSGIFKLDVTEIDAIPTGRDFGRLVFMETGVLTYQKDGRPTWESLKELVDKMFKD